MDVPLCIILHHGGRWECNPQFKYVGGNIKLVNDIPPDFDASFLKAVITSLGYNDVIKLHYCDPLRAVGDGLRFLNYEDTIFTTFVSMLYKCKMIDVFIEHDDDRSVGQSVGIAHEGTEEVDFDEEGSDNEDEEVKEARFLFKADKEASESFANEEELLERVAQRKGKSVGNDDSDYEDDSSDIDSPSESEDEECGYLLPLSNTKKRIRKSTTAGSFLLGRGQKQCPFFLGQQFEDAKEVRTADKDKHTVSVKTLKPNHNCGRVAQLKKLRASWIASNYQNKFKVNPYLKCQEIVETIWSEQVFGGGLLYRRAFWKVAKSTTEADWKRNMELFAALSIPAAKDLLNRNYKKWVRAYLTTTSCCDSIDNNMNEVFNAYILQSRHKPIITMLEDIREGLMERMHKKRDFIANKDISICPRIQAKLEKSKLDARGWSAFWDGHFCYGVREGATQVRYVVSLLERTCSCYAWQLSGVPCNHAVAAIWKAQEHPEHYVSNYFTKETYLKAYAFPLEPLNGPQEWPESSKTPIIPPPFKKLQNRPTTKRKPSLGEVDAIKLSKKGSKQSHKCSNCREPGHNKTKCPYPPQNATSEKPPAQPKQRKQKQATATVTPTQQSQTNSVSFAQQMNAIARETQQSATQTSIGSNNLHSTQMTTTTKKNFTGCNLYEEAAAKRCEAELKMEESIKPATFQVERQKQIIGEMNLGAEVSALAV
ncbi:Tyrosine-protein kinase JAK1 [Bienertia sinuspersici]